MNNAKSGLPSVELKLFLIIKFNMPTNISVEDINPTTLMVILYPALL
jgi:hypothetical protein